MNFKVGEWWHDLPCRESDASGRRAIVKHLCFGPLETRIWYELRNGQYQYEIHFIEGIQAGDIFTNSVSKPEMMEVIRTEIELCQTYGKPEWVSLLLAELVRMET